MTTLSTRDAYEHYADAMTTRTATPPVKFDSFRRWLTNGRAKVKKKGHFRQVIKSSLDALIEQEVAKAGGTPPTKARRARPDEKHDRSKKKARKSRGIEYQGQLLGKVFDQAGRNYVRELQDSSRRPAVIDEVLAVRLAKDSGSKSLLAYINELERLATTS